MESNDFLNMGGKKIALVLDAKDNVGVVLADVAKGDACTIREDGGREYELPAVENIGFGHKISLSALGKDAPVYKYGEEIGKMKEPIAKGGWIHTHNLYCERGM